MLVYSQFLLLFRINFLFWINILLFLFLIFFFIDKKFNKCFKVEKNFDKNYSQLVSTAKVKI